MIYLSLTIPRYHWHKCTSIFLRLHAVPFFSTSATSCKSTRKPFDRLNYNTDLSFEDSLGDYVNYELTTANDLESYTNPPNRVKMLVRDFIEDSLYNPNYGYFPHQATIFTSSKGRLDFTSFRDSVEFQNEVARCYTAYDEDGPGKQLWHTPTELFKVRNYS